MKKIVAAFTLSVALGASSHLGSSAYAATITFEEFGTTTVASSISSGGFTFAPADGSIFVITDADVLSSCIPDCASNGTSWLGASRPGGTPVSTQPVTMTQDNGGSFLLLGLDASELFVDLETTNLLIVGNLAGGGTISVNLALDGINDSQGGAADFQSFLLPAIWGTSPLSSVEFTGALGTGGVGDVSIDNLLVQSVPEPATLALLGIAFAGLGFSRRRKLH